MAVERGSRSTTRTAHGSAAARDSLGATHVELYKRFPPGWSHLRVPTSTRRAALAGIAMYGAARTRAIWSQRLACLLVRALGPRALPGAAAPWHPPVPSAQWAALLERWREELGDFHTMAVYERTQIERAGLALLLIGEAGSTAFVKLQPRALGSLHHETLVLRMLAAAAPEAFRICEPLAAGGIEDWIYLALTPLPPRLLAPCRRAPLAEIGAQIAAALRDLPRDAAAPAHWQPMHGDLTPWNLRTLPERGRVLLDWEDASWGPPRADAVLYRASAAALGAPLGPDPEPEEAIAFWEGRVRERADRQARDAALSAAILRALRELRTRRRPALRLR